MPDGTLPPRRAALGLSRCLLAAVMLVATACAPPPAPLPGAIATEDGLVRAPDLSYQGWSCSPRRWPAANGRAGGSISFVLCGLHDGLVVLEAIAAPDSSPVETSAAGLQSRYATGFDEVVLVSTRSVSHQGHDGTEFTFSMVDAAHGFMLAIDRLWRVGGQVLRVSLRGSTKALAANQITIDRWAGAVRFAALGIGNPYVEIEAARGNRATLKLRECCNFGVVRITWGGRVEVFQQLRGATALGTPVTVAFP